MPLLAERLERVTDANRDEALRRFAPWLKQRMDERGLGVNQLAEYTGIYGSAISRWLNGRSRPDPDNCVRLAEFFGRPQREVLQVAGWPTGDPEPVRPPDIFAAHADKLTDDQWAEVVKYAEWLIERDKRAGEK